MELKSINKILTGIIALTLAGIGFIVFSLYTLQGRVASLEAINEEKKTATSSIAVDLGPVLFKGFAGKPASLEMTTSGENKIIALRGHSMKNPKNAFEVVPAADTAIKNSIIGPYTNIYRITREANAKMNKVEEIELSALTIASMDDTYIVQYEARTGETINDDTPATSLTIFVQK